MISATIQGINRADNYEHTTAQNAKLISGKNIWIAVGGVALVAFVAYLIFKQ